MGGLTTIMKGAILAIAIVAPATTEQAQRR